MDIFLHSVAERGVPNRERVVLQVTAPCNTASYALLVGTSTINGEALPFSDNFFWIGDALLTTNDWIFVYTGHGEGRMDQTKDGRLFSVYMNRDLTVFHNPAVVPILIQIANYSTIKPLPPPPALPQYPLVANNADKMVQNMLANATKPNKN